MNIISLFDGISCGMVALKRAGLPVDNYYSSEIDPYAITISQKNYPGIHRLGNVNNFNDGWWKLTNGRMRLKQSPDLIMGGSPCQGFSIAGTHKSFDDPRSALFWHFVEIVNYYKPKYFLLENVSMSKDNMNVITQALGVNPICIDSALVSGQSRKRYYWTNIPGVQQPEDKGILLKDILQHGIVDRTKSYTVTATYYKGQNPDNYLKRKRGQLVFAGQANINGYKQRKAVYCEEGKAPTVLAASGGNHHVKVALDREYYRNLTPIECERLQTLPDDYTLGISNTQRYKAIGNGWTVDVIAHILRNIR